MSRRQPRERFRPPEAIAFLRIVVRILGPLSLLLVMTGLLPAPLCSQSADSPVPGRSLSVPQYIAQLRVASDVLAGGAPATIHNFRTALPGEWLVQTNGELLRVKTDWLAGALLIEENASANAQAVAQARQRLTVLREAAETLAAASQGSTAQQSRARGSTAF